MIVKDESHIIGTTLKNLVESIHLDYWVICDTGSTDTTKQIITDFFKERNIPGELHDDPWKNFGENRTNVMALAYKKTDYVLMFDADDAIEGTIELPKPMTSDLYGFIFTNESKSFSFHRYVIFNNQKRWKYVGVLHEYSECMEPMNKKELIVGNFTCFARTMGNRSKDSEKYKKDALVLKQAYEEATEKNDSIRNRYAFYCANSYKDCGMHTEAIEWYKKVLTLENWTQEKYVTCLRIYEMYDALKTPESGIYALVESLRYDKERVECVYNLIVHYLLKGMHDVSMKYYEIIQPHYEDKYPDKHFSEKLFVNTVTHNFYLPYHMIIVSDRMKRNAIGVKMFQIIFRNKYVHPNHWYLTHLFNNLQFFKPYIHTSQFGEELRHYVSLCEVAGYTPTPEQNETFKHIYTIGKTISSDTPVVIAILAKDKAYCLSFFLQCILNQTFSKKNTHLYIRTNDNNDSTEDILNDFVKKHKDEYASVFFDASSIDSTVRQYKEHEWNSERFRLLGEIRMESVNYAKERGAHYFVVDVDNFIVPKTLEQLVANQSLGVISPMLECKQHDGPSQYSNFHYDVDENGYYKQHPNYHQLIERKLTGIVRVAVVHCTYFIRNDLLEAVKYDDSSKRYEYVIFSDTLRKKDIPQYLDNRMWYGFLVLTDSDEKYKRILNAWADKMSLFS
jgi:glycosyltransferase involved in cell wall biosynthesis